MNSSQAHGSNDYLLNAELARFLISPIDDMKNDAHRLSNVDKKPLEKRKLSEESEESDEESKKSGELSLVPQEYQNLPLEDQVKLLLDWENELRRIVVSKLGNDLLESINDDLDEDEKVSLEDLASEDYSTEELLDIAFERFQEGILSQITTSKWFKLEEIVFIRNQLTKKVDLNGLMLSLPQFSPIIRNNIHKFSHLLSESSKSLSIIISLQGQIDSIYKTINQPSLSLFSNGTSPEQQRAKLVEIGILENRKAFESRRNRLVNIQITRTLNNLVGQKIQAEHNNDNRANLKISIPKFANQQRRLETIPDEGEEMDESDFPSAKRQRI